MHFPRIQRFLTLGVALFFAGSSQAQASFLHGEALDTMAEVISWVAMIVAPAVLIIVFWLVHILPEKIAEKKQHPQAEAIQVLCLLSVVFGGILWPLAWIWAYSKPVLYKLAYGTDKLAHGAQSPGPEDEIDALRRRVAELEAAQNVKKES